MSPGPTKQFDRDDVLEAAMLLFWEQGYEAAGVSQLLERTGIGRQSLYDTFGDKRSLFFETLNHYFRTRMGPMLAQLRAPGSPRQNLLAFFEYAGKQLEQSEFHGCLIGNVTAELSDRDPEVLALVRGYFDAIEDAYADLIQRGQDAGEFEKKIEPREVARLFMHLTHGLILLNKVYRDPRLAQGVIQSTLRLLGVR